MYGVGRPHHSINSQLPPQQLQLLQRVVAGEALVVVVLVLEHLVRRLAVLTVALRHQRRHQSRLLPSWNENGRPRLYLVASFLDHLLHHNLSPPLRPPWLHQLHHQQRAFQHRFPLLPLCRKSICWTWVFGIQHLWQRKKHPQQRLPQ